MMDLLLKRLAWADQLAQERALDQRVSSTWDAAAE